MPVPARVNPQRALSIILDIFISNAHRYSEGLEEHSKGHPHVPGVCSFPPLICLLYSSEMGIRADRLALLKSKRVTSADMHAMIALTGESTRADGFFAFVMGSRIERPEGMNNEEAEDTMRRWRNGEVPENAVSSVLGIFRGLGANYGILAPYNRETNVVGDFVIEDGRVLVSEFSAVRWDGLDTESLADVTPEIPEDA